METRVEELDTPAGLARVHIHDTVLAPRATLVLGHGAGAGVDSRDLAVLAEELPKSGIEVLIIEQPWKVAGKKVANHPGQLDKAWVSALTQLKGRGFGLRKLFVGGRSAGARVACRTAPDVQPDGVVALAFPLHRPGVPEASRLPDLIEAVSVAPVLVVQGARDSFGGPDEIALAALEQGVALRVISVAWAGHTFSTPAKSPVTTEECLSVIAGAVREFVLG